MSIRRRHHRRYLESSGTLGHTRAFLYHEIGLTHLFHGDGFTRTEDGQVGACPHDTRKPTKQHQISH
jgi:hypothetical protein